MPSQCRCFAAISRRAPQSSAFFPFLPIYLFVMIFALPVSLFYAPNACTFPLFSLFNPPHSPCPPLTAASICCPPLLFLRLSAPRPSVVSPFCRLVLLSFYSLVAFPFFFYLLTQNGSRKKLLLFRLPFLPALQSGRRSVFAAIVCPMILRPDQFVPAPFTRKFVIRLPFPTKRRSLSYVLSLLGL